MPFGVQAKILRLLQERSIGGSAAGNHSGYVRISPPRTNLEGALAEASSGKDLYYRLKVVTISLPPLRNGKAIFRFFAIFPSRYSKKMSIANPGINEEALRMLCGYSWPGNVRELSTPYRRPSSSTRRPDFSRGHRKGERDFPVRPLRSGFPRGSRAGVGAASFGIGGRRRAFDSAMDSSRR